MASSLGPGEGGGGDEGTNPLQLFFCLVQTYTGVPRQEEREHTTYSVDQGSFSNPRRSNDRDVVCLQIGCHSRWFGAQKMVANDSSDRPSEEAKTGDANRKPVKDSRAGERKKVKIAV